MYKSTTDLPKVHKYQKIPSAVPVSIYHSRNSSSLGFYSSIVSTDSTCEKIVNFHYNSKTSRFLKDENRKPSIVSSVLYLRKKSEENTEKKIFKYTGGGFKGSLKSERFKSLLPCIRLQEPELKKVKRKYSKNHYKFKLMHPLMTKTTELKSKFREEILGHKLASEEIF